MSISMVEDFSPMVAQEVTRMQNHIGKLDSSKRKEKTSELVVHPVGTDSPGSRDRAKSSGSADYEKLPQLSPSTRIRLALEKLQGFEKVEEQFQHWGIKFHNAIALQPSNPRFGIEPGVTVLMGAPKGGALEVTFSHAVRQVWARVTSSRHTVMSAFDENGQLLATDEIKVNKPSDSIGSVLPNAELTVTAKNISKITFYTFDAQLIVDHLKVEF
ncbi:MAG: hypothetical protein P5702_09570 [Limnospira sp. PMC 1291.21]|uniref:Uncharacterized protein n=1 Tax=Limnospira fusiformis PMC 851.14 TaxID=2219512 RepID=A0ABU9EGJ5_LIMFS|nr:MULTISPECIES: hypothetical protein [Limnospira]EKD07076.1 hypothetical protein SPLC1_S500520 [Arthrospira platensis C1]MDY7053470.1 hypothetical protein [Limnospira fusiformis LS22]QJB26068.1 hypothetical protein HFV01_10060 [Limnospira fusiformis SAG 85.79]MDT9177792.1 hypothetical protein [Limnospira sp. PMC 1238.20]MDT9187927.1 hypothetical protein [Limnospira sp. PMC 894.15]